MIKWNADAAVQFYMDEKRSLTWIADRYGCSLSAAYTRLRKHPDFVARKAGRPAVDKTAERPRAPKEKRIATEQQIARWLDGATFVDLSRQYKIDQITMARSIRNHPRYEEFLAQRIEKFGVAPGKSKVNIQEARDLYVNKRWTIYQIATKFGVTHQRVQQLLAKHYPEVLREKKELSKAIHAIKDAEKQKSKNVNSKKRSAINNGIKLYLEGFTFDEIKKTYPSIRKGTLQSRLYELRQEDPNFPSERGREGRPYNWQDRMITVTAMSSTYKEAAELIGIQYPTFLNRINKLRARGIKI